MSNLALYMRFLLALAATGLFGWALMQPEGEINGNLTTALVALTTAAWSWFFGSSKGSSDKTDRMFPDA